MKISIMILLLEQGVCVGETRWPRGMWMCCMDVDMAHINDGCADLCVGDWGRFDGDLE